MVITPLPEPPSRSDPSTFAAKGDAFLAALNTFVTEANALLAQCEANATTLLSVSEIADYIAANGISISADGIGFEFSDGTKVQRDASGGLRIIPASDSLPPIVRNAANDANVLLLKPASSAETITGTITDQPVSPAADKASLDARHLYAEYQHTASAGSGGGTATNGAWRTLPITTEVTDELSSSLASDVITLPAGKYEITFFHQFNATQDTIARLVLTPTGGSASYKYSTAGYALTTETAMEVHGKTVVDFLANGGTVAWQYRVFNTKTSTGLGFDVNLGVTNVFGSIFIRKIG